MRFTNDEVITVPGWGVCSVVSADDPSLITLRLPSGHCLRVGHKALADMVAPDNRMVKTEQVMKR